MIAILVLCLAFGISYGQSVSRTECGCLSNATDEFNGQFAEQITIVSNINETWTLVSVEGLFSADSPAPPANPIPFVENYELTSSGTGVYVLDAIRVTGNPWQVELSNGSTTIPVTSAHVCNYPSQEVVGDMGTCIGTIETYEVDLPANQVQNIVWTLSGGGNIVGGQGTRKIFVDWGDVVGDYDLSFVGSAFSYEGQNNDPCFFEGTSTIGVMDEEAFAIACNNQVNISLNGQCELDLVADMILEDMMFSNDSYDLEFTDTDTGDPVVGPTLGMEYVGKKLQVKVIHECSGNSCWGYVLLEDKSIPQLECADNVTIDCDEVMDPNVTGFPVGDDVTVINIGGGNYILQDYDLCSDVTLSYTDTPVESNLCEGPFSSIVERAWLATDGSGNTTTCTQRIFVNRATLDDITFPESYDDILGPNPSLEACGGFPTLPNGNPDPSFTGMPQGVFCLNVEVDFEDTRLDICGDNAYKIRRRWTVRDLCHNSEDVSFTQNITVMDNAAPVCVAPPEFTVNASPLTCTPLIEVPAPLIVFECSDYSYTVSYKIPDENGDPFFQPTNEGVVQQADGSFLISGLDDLEGNMVWIVYYVTDECDNLSTCFTEVTIVDNEQPIPVCDLHTFVGLNEDGIGYASIESFDDGSYDNCSDITREVRRVNNFGCGESSQWSDKVKFCCEDVGQVIMIQMRVTDESGNSNICMVEAEVQDNHAPEITFCPADITIDCDDDTVNLDQYGVAQATDNCDVTITSTAQRSINACGTGLITRRFKAEDSNGNTDECIQRIRVEALDPFYINNNNPNDPNDDVVWPADHTILNGCATSGVDPSQLPAGKQRPQILSEGCSQVSYTFEDVIFQYTDEACSKILRTWTVIDDCVHTPFSTQGIWYYTQVIKVENATAPTFIQGCSASEYTITQNANCLAQIQGTATAVDDCTSPDELEFRYKIDESNNGSFDYQGTGNTINRAVSFGTHRIVWEVEDECGNISNCAAVITVEDNKAPTPYCLSEIATVIMDSSGDVTIWASDFDNGSTDNCTPQDELRLSLSPNPNMSSMTFTCDDMTSSTTTFDVTMYVTDAFGNQDFCTTKLVVQDNNNNCPNVDDGSGNGGRVALGGQILNDVNQTIENVSVSIDSDLPEFPMATMTDTDGAYVFNELVASQNYTVSPSLEDNYNDGVSTLDLVLIQRHLLGLASFDNPYKVIAADINNSESITASDLLQLRKLILGIYSELPNNESWRFVDAHATFADNDDPFPFAEQMDMPSMSSDYMDADFVAIKIGDVNNSATTGLQGAETASTRSSMTMTLEDIYLEPGVQTVEVDIDEVADVFGLQFAMDINDQMISDINLASDVLNVTANNYTVERNTLVASIDNASSETVTDNILSMIIDVKRAGYLSEMISINSGQINNEIYIESGAEVTARTLGLEITNRSSVAHQFELLQNVPNPFNTTTEIGFVLPADQDVTLRVFDVTGKVLVSKSGRYNQGFNTIRLDVSEINATGVVYYQIDTEANSASKKMIIIK